MALRDSIASGLSGIAGTVERIAGAVRSPLASPTTPLPTVTPTALSHREARSSGLHDALRTWGAFSSRVATDAGPSPDRFSTYPGTNLTPETIIAVQQEAVASGLPQRWIELIDQVLSRDGHYAGVAGQRVDDVIKGTWRLTRASNDDAATAMRNFAELAYRECERFTDGLGWLLWANAYCYNGIEPEWEERRLTFPGPRGEVIGPVTVAVPRKVWQVHPKHFRFDLRTDEALLWLGADGVSLPFGKVIFHTGEGLHPLAVRRGHAWQCVWYSFFRSIGWAGWATFVDRFGLPVPIIRYDADIASFAEYQAAYTAILNSLGTGKGAIVPQSGTQFEIKDPPSGGRSSDPHSALSDACDAGQSIRVLGATLTAKIGNVGSFAASSTHAEVKYAREEGDARRLWETVDEQLTRALVWFNAQALAQALNDKGYSVTPEMLCQRVPRGKHRVPRESDPATEIEIINKAVNDLGLDVSVEDVFDRFDFKRALGESDRVRGRAQSVAKDAALMTPSEAAEGAAVNRAPDTVAKAENGGAMPPANQPQPGAKPE